MLPAFLSGSIVPRPPKRKGRSGEHSTSSHELWASVAMDSLKSQPFEVSCWTSVNWSVC